MLFQYSPCQCAETQCLKGVQPPSDCVNRLQGTVKTATCSTCQAETVHHNGECLRCQRLEVKSTTTLFRTDGDRKNRLDDTTKSTLSVKISLGEGSIVVRDKKAVSKILKIILEG